MLAFLGFWYQSVFLFSCFISFSRNDHLNRRKITQKISQQNTYRAGIFVLQTHLRFQVCFLFQFDFFSLFSFFFYCVDSRALIHRSSRRQNKSKLIMRRPSERFTVHSASLLAFRKRLCFSEREQIEH